jgi:predicted methyltransferase
MKMPPRCFARARTRALRFARARTRALRCTTLLAVLAACGPAQQPVENPSAAPSNETSVEVTRVEVPPEAAQAAPPAAEPSAADKQRAELEAERSKMVAEHEQEVARFTPELRAQAKALAEKRFASTRAALPTILKSAHRKPGHAARDKDRHPLETLEFLGVTPKQSVLEYGPGEGWYTELLAPLLASRGKLAATNPDPNGPPEKRGTFYGQRFKLFVETSPEVYGKVTTLTVDGEAPSLPADTKFDTVLVFRGLHGMVNQSKLDAWLAVFHEALNDKGVLGIEQHRAKEGADPIASAKTGYLPEAWVIAEIEKAGFKLLKKSEINKNPKDTKDHPNGVWSLPPSLREGDKDREKYVAIGESDRMTLKFQKVSKPTPAAEKPAPAAAAPAAEKPAAAKPAAPVAPAAPAATATAPAATPAAPATKP